MSGRSTDEATADDLDVMTRELRDALPRRRHTGSRPRARDQHETSDDRPVASRLASWDEVRAPRRRDGRRRRRRLPARRGPSPNPGRCARRLDPAPHRAGRRDGCADSPSPPVGDHGRPSSCSTTAAQAGGRMFGLTHCRGIGEHGARSGRGLPFDSLPEWKAAARAPARGATAAPARTRPCAIGWSRPPTTATTATRSAPRPASPSTTRMRVLDVAGAARTRPSPSVAARPGCRSGRAHDRSRARVRLRAVLLADHRAVRPREREAR